MTQTPIVHAHLAHLECACRPKSPCAFLRAFSISDGFLVGVVADPVQGWPPCEIVRANMYVANFTYSLPFAQHAYRVGHPCRRGFR
jgi:hypothetical protein